MIAAMYIYLDVLEIGFYKTLSSLYQLTNNNNNNNNKV